MEKKTQIAIALIITVLALGEIFLLIQTTPQPVSEQSSLQKILSSGELNVCYVIWEPTTIKDPNTGELSGEFVDAIRIIADNINVEPRFHETTFGTFSIALQSRRCDVSIAATFRTIPRAASIAFTKPIIFVGNGAIVKMDDKRFDPTKSVFQFDRAEYKIALIQGEASHEFVKENFENAELIVISATPNLSLAPAEVSSGRADVALVDAPTTANYAKANADVIDFFAENPYNLTAVGWAVRQRDTELLDFLNTSIDFLESTGKFDELSDKYGSQWTKPRIIYETR